MSARRKTKPKPNPTPPEHREFLDELAKLLAAAVLRAHEQQGPGNEALAQSRDR